MLLSLVSLWFFAAWVTSREGLNLLAVSLVDQKVSRPLTTLVQDLEAERRLTMVFLGHGDQAARQALADQRERTDAQSAKFIKDSDSARVDFAEGDLAESRIELLTTQLKGMEEFRGRIDAGALTRGAAADGFNLVIDTGFQIFAASSSVDDEGIARDARTVVTLTRAKEIFAREDALLAGVLAVGRITPAERIEFTKLVGLQNSLHLEAIAELSGDDLKRYEQFREGPLTARLRTLEQHVMGGPVNAGPVNAGKVGFTSDTWQSASAPMITALDEMVRATADGIVSRAAPVAAGVIVRLVLAGGLGFIAVLASIILAVTTSRDLVRQLERLKNAAHELADVRLPSVVERLGHGEQVDVKAEAPPLEFGDDDIGKVGQAFNAVQETAIRTAVEQAELRRGIRDILLSLARRSQALVHRQLTLLDAMERREIDTEELEDLFRVDHLATRMRRNSENLIILSGATPARGWRRPVPMVDVVRSAVAEVEDYTRVTVMPIGEVQLIGRAVTDMAHLLAELIENAVSFSPPYTVAQISGHLVASGYAIEIEDRGLGMSDENLEQINQRILNPPEFNLSSSVQLGLYVVGKLAERYGVQVTLKRSPYGGTTAVVVIPRDLIEEGAGAEPSPQHQLTAVASVMSEADHTVQSGGGSGQVPLAAPVLTEAPAPAAVPQPVADTSGTTPAGLPVRVPQASLAAPLKEEPAASAAEEIEDPGRSPEEIRRIVGAFQIGAKRGRAASAENDSAESGTE
ncbi:sensor histidine kinase [Actinocorallia lasiicapitis]